MAWRDGRINIAQHVDRCTRMYSANIAPDPVAAQLTAWQEASGFAEIMCQCHLFPFVRLALSR